MSHDSHHRERDRWARLRFSIIGPLLAAPPGPGELHEAITELAEKSWRHPITGAPLHFGVSTLERWYYAARRAQQDPVGVLRRRLRQDAGKPRRMCDSFRQALEAQYQAHPSWSYCPTGFTTTTSSLYWLTGNPCRPTRPSGAI